MLDVCRYGSYVAAGRWFSPGTLVSSLNKTDSHDITEMWLKVALSTIPISSPHQARHITYH